jgi:hypothetical protein
MQLCTYRRYSHPTLETSIYKPIYNITFMIGGSHIRTHGYYITDSHVHIGLKQENNGILPTIQ